MPGDPEEMKDAIGKADSQAMRRIYAKRYADFVNDQVEALWNGDLTHADAMNLVRTIGDPTRRDAYLKTLWWAQRQPIILLSDGRRIQKDLLGKDGSRVFKEALSEDVFADANEVLSRAGFADLLSNLAWRIGSHQGVRAADVKANSLGDLFED